MGISVNINPQHSRPVKTSIHGLNQTAADTYSNPAVISRKQTN